MAGHVLKKKLPTGGSGDKVSNEVCVGEVIPARLVPILMSVAGLQDIASC